MTNGMPHYALRFFFDGATGVCLWAGNTVTAEAFDYPVDLEMLHLPTPVEEFGNQVIQWWTQYNDLNDSEKDENEYAAFRDQARELLVMLRNHLGAEFEIFDEFGLTAFRSGVVIKIISGGQTGVDRAALDWAIERGLPHGGWCPKGRLAEDGVIDSRYLLQETESANYRQRTRQNVVDSDGTLTLNIGDLSDGSLTTLQFAEMQEKPCMVVQMEDGAESAHSVMKWLEDHKIAVLNIAGPRESKRPGIYVETQTFLNLLASFGTNP